MIQYKGTIHNVVDTATDFEQVGVLRLDQTNTIPFFSVYFKGKILPRLSEEYCSETNGDCYEFHNKYVKFEWIH